ncbi:RING/U-box [Glarea lozoyensis ATCC 20868]|uniref:RBR-type E3 ubiquitin transferase n=1 Tax=Glarea lozoyensis (strain ATCC 20868 / MF5171) TaxID=1116229 RepID=S3DCG4_GLAL2|nr:RING/U-box [Glarea lozoyensis ATCC 20868]EPE29696.1 RING/U-box [Glarea lozoyensis ATCC 20868]
MASRSPPFELRKRCLDTFKVPYHRFTRWKLIKVLEHYQQIPRISQCTKEGLFVQLEDYTKANDINQDIDLICRFVKTRLLPGEYSALSLRNFASDRIFHAYSGAEPPGQPSASVSLTDNSDGTDADSIQFNKELEFNAQRIPNSSLDDDTGGGDIGSDSSSWSITDDQDRYRPGFDDELEIEYSILSSPDLKTEYSSDHSDETSESSNRPSPDVKTEYDPEHPDLHLHDSDDATELFRHLDDTHDSDDDSDNDTLHNQLLVMLASIRHEHQTPKSPVQARGQKRQRETRLCIICLDSPDVDLFPEANCSETCAHEINVCTDCLTAHIGTQIRESPLRILCPGCSEPVGYQVVKTYASSEEFDRFERLGLMEAFKDDPSFIMCLGPNCDSGQLHEGGENEPIMECNSCHFKTCFVHKLPWHSGQTCEEYDLDRKEKLDQEAATNELLQRETKTCPNKSCGLHVMKISGCDHMTCHRCRFEFCWLCLAPYQAIRAHGNHYHEKNCRYYFDDTYGPRYEYDSDEESDISL